MCGGGGGVGGGTLGLGGEAGRCVVRWRWDEGDILDLDLDLELGG